ncbi:hypothetical protein RN96_08670 [Fusobacterium polymorphum]|uniref:Uncharacterized protein n=1 Tax=Fusobacterium nucleatum subsp. polymorphum TaxID=76857 RepID=A0A2B7YJA3_FUSNP|nr:hypothetical protein [Fusobacterium polymorphum]PGH21093.1 hypothetical protein RN96_08670 [Fusobacterium polymorphum]
MITIEEIKSILNKKFINNYQTITRVSERTDHNEDKISMLENEFKIFNYDDGILKIINKQKNQEPICAVDAIDIQEDIIYFIEFKDGAVFGAKPKDKYQLRLKMIESIFQLLDVVLGLPLNKFKEFLDLKKVFILVYNEDNAYKGIYPEEKELRYNEYKRRLEKYKETLIYSDIKLYKKEKFEEKYIKKYLYG